MFLVKNISDQNIPLYLNGSTINLPSSGKIEVKKITPQIKNLAKPSKGRKSMLSFKKKS